jgi:hypothetical protein
MLLSDVIEPEILAQRGLVLTQFVNKLSAFFATQRLITVLASGLYTLHKQ